MIFAQSKEQPPFFNLSFTFLLPAKTVIQSAAFRSNTLHYLFIYFIYLLFCLYSVYICESLRGKKTLVLHCWPFLIASFIMNISVKATV